MQSWHAGQRERERERLSVGKLSEPDSIMHLDGIFHDEPSSRDVIVLCYIHADRKTSPYQHIYQKQL